MALLVRVCRCAAIGRKCNLIVELDDVRCGALGRILAHMLGVECEPGEAELAILGIFLEGGLCIFRGVLLPPAELSAAFLRVHLHAPSRIAVTVLLGLVPTVVRNLALVVLSAHLAILAILLADRLKRPILRSMAVETFNAVGVVVAGSTFLVTDAHFLTVTALALAGDRASPPRI